MSSSEIQAHYKPVADTVEEYCEAMGWRDSEFIKHASERFYDLMVSQMSYEMKVIRDRYVSEAGATAITTKHVHLHEQLVDDRVQFFAQKKPVRAIMFGNDANQNAYCISTHVFFDEKGEPPPCFDQVFELISKEV